MIRRFAFAINLLGFVTFVSSCRPYRDIQWLDDNVVVKSNQKESPTAPSRAAREKSQQRHRDIVEMWAGKSPRVKTGEYQVWAEQQRSGKFSGSVLFKAKALKEERVIASCNQLVVDKGIVSMSGIYHFNAGEAAFNFSEDSSLEYQIDSGTYEATGSGRAHIEIPVGAN